MAAPMRSCRLLASCDASHHAMRNMHTPNTRLFVAALALLLLKAMCAFSLLGLSGNEAPLFLEHNPRSSTLHHQRLKSCMNCNSLLLLLIVKAMREFPYSRFRGNDALMIKPSRRDTSTFKAPTDSYVSCLEFSVPRQVRGPAATNQGTSP